MKKKGWLTGRLRYSWLSGTFAHKSSTWEAAMVSPEAFPGIVISYPAISYHMERLGGWKGILPEPPLEGPEPQQGMQKCFIKQTNK